MPMQPNPMAETSRPLFPSLRFWMFLSFDVQPAANQPWYCSSLTCSIQSTVLPSSAS